MPGSMNATPGLKELSQSLVAQQRELEHCGGIDRKSGPNQPGPSGVRRRLAQLLDPREASLEIGLWAGRGTFDRGGNASAPGVVTCVGSIAGQPHVVIAHDRAATQGMVLPTTARKILRAQQIALENRIPVVYVVDSPGTLLPLDDDQFPDEHDPAHIVRHQVVLSQANVRQTMCLLGPTFPECYEPALCDAVVIEREASHGAALPPNVTRCVEPNEAACLARIRSLTASLPAVGTTPGSPFHRFPARASRRPGEDLYDLVPADPRGQFDIHGVLDCILDEGSFDEFKAQFGKTLVCGTARINGFPLGVVANQRQRVRTADGEFQFGGVIYVDSADKAARFVLNCNQDWLPILFLQDVNGFMIGRSSERAGIIKAGAKLVNAVSNSRVPKVTLFMGASFGAGNYALCGRAFDPRFLIAWPNARCAVMGGEQATETLLEITAKSLQRQGVQVDEQKLRQLHDQVRETYDRQMDSRYAAERGWVDAIIDPAMTRQVLTTCLELCTRHADPVPLQVGVFQV